MKNPLLLEKIEFTRSASITISKGNKVLTIMRKTIAECENYRLEKYPNWLVIHSYELDKTEQSAGSLDNNGQS